MSGRRQTDIVERARQYGRYGYRKIAELLRRAGWLVNDQRVERIYRACTCRDRAAAAALYRDRANVP